MTDRLDCGMKYITVTILLFLLLFAAPYAAAATLSGICYDRSTDKPLASVTIAVQNTDYRAVSDSVGYFEITDFDGGIYDITGILDGYKPAEIKRLRLGSRQSLVIELRLKPLTPQDRKRGPRSIYRMGSLKGKVVTTGNGDPLPGAVITVTQLAVGAISTVAGSYQIVKLKPGSYTVEATLIGFKQVRNYSVDVFAGEETILDFQLEETVLPLGSDIIVYGKKPLLDITEPAAIRSIEHHELELSTVRNISDIIKELPGVVEIDNEIHVRGGRTYETQYIIDGVVVTDPLIRKGIGHSINTDAIQELKLYSGGADAEFSGATSGIVEITTREGQQELAASLNYRNDHLSGSSGFNSDVLELSLSGPEPATTALLRTLGLPGEAYFFGSGSFRFSDTYLPYSRNLYSSTLSGESFAPRSDNQYAMFTKLSWKISPLAKLSFSHSASARINQDRSILQTRIRTIDYSYGYPYEYEKILDNYNTFTQKSNQQTLILDYRFSLEKRLKLTASRFFTTLHSDVRGKHFSEYVAPVDDEPDIFEPSPDSSYFTIERGDGFFDSGDGDSWYDHFIENYGFKVDYETDIERNYSLKLGLEGDHQTVQVVDIFKPWLGESGFGLNYDAYQAKPATYGAFVQNKLNLQGMIFDFGMRYDLWFPGKYAEDALADTNISVLGEVLRNQFDDGTTTVLGRQARGVISPRFGIANLITRNLTLFGSYSRFARRPPPQYLYAKLYTPSQSAYQFFGNPALDFEKTTNMEAGIKYLPNKKSALAISGYIKYIQDYIAATLIAPDPRFPDESYFLYFNLDYATSQGVEIEYLHEYSDVFKISASTAFSKAKGERSLPQDILRGIQTRSEGAIYNEISFDWDKPWQFVLKANINAPGDRTLRPLGLPLPRDWNLNVKFWGQAGKRYTPYREITDEFGFEVFVATGETNSKVGPWWNSVDISFQKYFRFGRYSLTLYVEATNLFDHKNVTLINPLTGEEYREGDKIPRGGNLLELPAFGYQLPLWENPTRYLSPRQVMLGLGVSL